MEFALVALASLLAGMVDSIVGGGGLILVPALFAAYPGAPPATMLGTNKSASVWGTSVAAVQYSRRVPMRWAVVLPAAFAALAGSVLGAWTVTQLDPGFLRKALPFILLGVLLYTLARKNLGDVHAPHLSPTAERAAACAIGAVLGWYDGFFGPGTGSLFIFLLVRVLGYDFLNASAAAKVLNAATNASALVLFTVKGHVWWHIGVVLAVANVAGSLIGSRLALRHGTGFVRGVFIVVVLSLVIKTGYDAFLR